MIQANVTLVDWPTDDEFAKEFNSQTDEIFQQMAQDCAADARALCPVKTGKLQNSIKAKKSRYETGGWICQAKAPHAHLVELGHAQVTKSGVVVGHVAPHPFLGPARDRVIADAISKLRS